MINFVVPITGSRLSNAVRFLRNWRHIFEADRSLKLIVSFAGNDTDRDHFDKVLKDEMNQGWLDKGIVTTVTCPLPFTRAPCIQNGIDLLRLGKNCFKKL